MANWCFNTLEITGKEECVEKVFELFQTMKNINDAENCGAKPFEEEPDKYFFDIDIYGDYINYQTKWAPNVEDVIKIADKFNVDFILSYEESGNGIYGEYHYTNKVLKDWCLDDNDFEQVSYDDDTEMYKFRDELWESETEPYDILLKEKIKNYDKKI